MATTEQPESTDPLWRAEGEGWPGERRRLVEENASLRRRLADVEGHVVALAQRDALIEQLHASLRHRDELVARLEGEVAELKRRLGQDSLFTELD